MDKFITPASRPFSHSTGDNKIWQGIVMIFNQLSLLIETALDF